MSYIQNYKNAIVRNLFNYMKENDIRNIDKRKIYQIAKDTYLATNKQREYFISYYGLRPEKFEREQIVDIAKKTNSRASEIKSTINSMIYTKLCFICKEYFLIIERIYKRYQVNEYLKLYNEYKEVVDIYKNSIEQKLNIEIIGKVFKSGRLVIPIKVRKKLKIIQGDKINISIKNKNLILELVRNENEKNENSIEVKRNGYIIIPKKYRNELEYNTDGQLVKFSPRINRIILEKY